MESEKNDNKEKPFKIIEDSLEELLQGDMNDDKDDRSAHSHNQPGLKAG